MVAAAAILALGLAGCSSTETGGGVNGTTPPVTSQPADQTSSVPETSTIETGAATSVVGSDTSPSSVTAGASSVTAGASSVTAGASSPASSASSDATAATTTAPSTKTTTSSQSGKVIKTTHGNSTTSRPSTTTANVPTTTRVNATTSTRSNTPTTTHVNVPPTTRVSTSHADQVTYREYTQDVTIPQPETQRVNDPSLDKGTTKTVQTGHSGIKTITYRQKYVNGVKSGSPTVVNSQTTKDAVPTIIHVGTKVAAPVVTYKTYTKDTTIPKPPAQHVDDPSLYVGEHQTVAGHTGVKTTTYKQKYVDGKKSGSPTVTGSTVTKKAVADVIHDGTKPKPAPHWIYNGTIAAQVAADVNNYRVAHGATAVSHSASQSMTPDAGGSVHAWGYSNAQDIVDAWAASPEHEQAMMVVWASSVVCGYWTMSDNSKGPYAGCLMQ